MARQPAQSRRKTNDMRPGKTAMTTGQARRRPDPAANTGASTVDDGEIARFDALAGRPVRVLAGERVEEGVAIGIDAGGGLRVRHADGERVHHAGEVSVRVAA